MRVKNRYNINDFRFDFPSDDKCREFIFDTIFSRKCICGGNYASLKGRKQFQCSKCRTQVAPTSGTVFHKSSTPLTLWFYAIWAFSTSGGNILVTEMEQYLGVTYKCAWRIRNILKGTLVLPNGKVSKSFSQNLCAIIRKK